jgi:hypothetical protein
VPAEQLSDFALRQLIFVNQSEDDPRFFQFVRRAGNAIEVEDGGFGGLLIDLEKPGLKRWLALERASRAKTLEAIDEYRSPSS